MPPFVTQLINHTRQGHVEWEQVESEVFHLTDDGGDAEVFVRSRAGDGLPPHVLVITSTGGPGSETIGNSGDPAYDAAFSELFAVARDSALAPPDTAF